MAEKPKGNAAEVTVPTSYIISYLILNAITVFVVASMNARERDFGDWLFYGYAWSFPAALAAYFLLLYFRIQNLPKDEHQWYSQPKLQENSMEGLVDAINKHIEYREDMERRAGRPVEKVGVFPPAKFFIPYLILIMIAVFWGASIEGRTGPGYNPTYHGDRQGDALITMLGLAAAFTFIVLVVWRTMSRIAPLPAANLAAEEEAKRVHRAPGFGTDDDLKDALKS